MINTINNHNCKNTSETKLITIRIWNNKINNNNNRPKRSNTNNRYIRYSNYHEM